MIALTQEKREELANYARARLASHVVQGGCSDEEDIFKIALAAITAVPDHHVFKHPLGKLFSSLVDESCKGHDGVYPVYAVPPVPEIKLRKLPTLKEVSQIHPGPKEMMMSFKDGAAWMLSEIESLGGLGD